MPIAALFMLSVVVFSIGALGLLIRRNAIVMFLSIELMLNAANIFIASVSKLKGNAEGQVIVLFIMAIAAAEAAVGMAIITAFYRKKGTVDIERADLMRW